MIFDDTPVRGDYLPNAWAGYYENLATPQENPAYDQAHYESVMTQIKLIYSLAKNEGMRIPHVTDDQCRNIISRLKQRKTADIYDHIWSLSGAPSTCTSKCLCYNSLHYK